MRTTSLWAGLFLVAGTLPVHAQQVVEIDFTNGRTIIDDEWRRDMDPYQIAVDWDRDILYLHDSEEPEGVMAFSLETGEWLRTLPTRLGEGPFEFPYGPRGMAVAPDGGLYVAGGVKVVHLHQLGLPVFSWRPDVPVSTRVCNLGGAPAVPAQGGVVRRKPNGSEEPVGPVSNDGHFTVSEGSEPVLETAYRIYDAEIACAPDRAYVTMSYDIGPDSVFVYHRDGREGRVLLPTEGIDGMMDCRPWRYAGTPPPEHCHVALRNLVPSLDEKGNLVLFGFDSDVHGVVINPESGCHALVRNRTRLHYLPVAVRGDSVLVFHSHVTERRTREGQVRYDYRDTAKGVSINSFRHISGAPCPGILGHS